MRKILTNTDGQWFIEMKQKEYETTIVKIGEVLTKLIDGEITLDEMKENIRENSGLLIGDECRYGDASEYFPRDIALAVAALAEQR